MRVDVVAVAHGLLALLLAGVPLAAQRNWTVERTPWGDPDLQAVWSGDAAGGIPIQRPVQLGTKAELTDQEFAEKQQRDARARKQGEDAVGSMRIDSAWLDRTFRQTSLVVDPPDGRIPPLVPSAEARRTPVGTYGNGPFDSPADLTLYDRCVTLGVVGTMVPRVYGNGFRIVQAPGVVAIMAEMIHEARVIPLDGPAHIAPAITQDMGDARGHWEGDTLVVETTNFKARSVYRNANPARLKLTERFVRIAPNRVRWSVTVDDPTTWTRPWTFSMPLTADDQPLPLYECHEGNYGLRNILSAARAEERARAADK